MIENKEPMHILGPRARGVQISFIISDELKPEKNILWANNMKYHIKLNPDFGDYALKVLCMNSELYQLCNILGFNSEEILNFIGKLNKIMVNTIKSAIDLQELEDLQKHTKKQINKSIKEEIKNDVLTSIQVQIDKLKNKATN